MSNLQLSLKKQWFEMTKSGVKTEDYRQLTFYWCSRFLVYNGRDISQNNWRLILATAGINYIILCIGKSINFKPFTNNIMTLGYPKAGDTSRILRLEHKGIEIRTGNPEWGAEPNKLYFVIKHGKIIQ